MTLECHYQGDMSNGGDEFDIDAVIIIRDAPELGDNETAEMSVEIRNLHLGVALNDALRPVRHHPYSPGELLHEKIRYELNCEGYEIEDYHHLHISFPVSNGAELGVVSFVVEVSEVGVLSEGS